jgi:glycosyltransferase involved in cell wall biosynthesis
LRQLLNIARARALDFAVLLLAALAGLSRGREKRVPERALRVLHVSPLYFDASSYIGGGERYATELARSMAEKTPTKMVSFNPEPKELTLGSLKIRVYRRLGGPPWNPTSIAFLKDVVRADVIHCYHFRTLVTALSALVATILGKRIFVTDLGGSLEPNFRRGVEIKPLIDRWLHISRYSSLVWPETGDAIIYGGVSETFLEAEPLKERVARVLYVGRLLPHKGINYLVEAVDPDVELLVIGREHESHFVELLASLARGKNVTFQRGASDAEILQAYRTSTVTVLPSVYKDVYGTEYKHPELLGLTLLESMACGTPVICTGVGAMPEYVEDGVSGFIVPPNDPAALHERISWLLQNPNEARTMGQAARMRVEREFTWSVVADRCLAEYRR